jgi:colanic acid/amylovoran biosynthesis glycosyltransferase
LIGSLRVAFVVPEFPRLSETFVVERFLGLVERGVDAHVVCGRFDRASVAHFPRLREVPGLRARIHVEPRTQPRWRAFVSLPFVLLACGVRHPIVTLTYIARGYRTWGIRLLAHLYRDAALALIRPRVVHFEFGVNARHRIASCKLLGARVIVSFQGADINYAGLDAGPGYYAEVWRHADLVHTASEDLWRRAVSRGCPAHLSHAVLAPMPNAAAYGDEPAIAARPRNAGGPMRLVSIGRLHWKKGFEYGLEAVRMLAARGIDSTLRIVGDGPHADALRFTVCDLGLGDRVTFTGALPPEAVLDELRSADVFLHPSISEGFSLVVLEAQTLGIPVVTTDADGLQENLEADVTGIVVPRRDPEALAEALERLARDPALRAAMGKAGWERSRTHFAPGIVMDRYEQLYREVAGA